MMPMIVYKLDYAPDEYYVDVFTGELYTINKVRNDGFIIMSKEDAFRIADEYILEMKNQGK